MMWRLHHTQRTRTVKIHRSMHDIVVEDFAHIPHGIRHTLFRPSFWLGITLSFPLEHWLWEHVWPLTIITRGLGL